MNKEEACKKLIKEVEIFIKGNDIEYIFDNDWRIRFLVLLFPNISKTLTWLAYSMEHLNRVVNQVKAVHDKTEP